MSKILDKVHKCRAALDQAQTELAEAYYYKVEKILEELGGPTSRKAASSGYRELEWSRENKTLRACIETKNTKVILKEVIPTLVFGRAELMDVKEFSIVDARTNFKQWDNELEVLTKYFEWLKAGDIK